MYVKEHMTYDSSPHYIFYTLHLLTYYTHFLKKVSDLNERCLCNEIINTKNITKVKRYIIPRRSKQNCNTA